MVFSTSIFLLLFLPLFLIAYELTPKQWKNYTLVVASIGFYSWGAPKFIFVLLTFTIINYCIVERIYRLEKITSRKNSLLFDKNRLITRKNLLVLSIVLHLILLVIFKYANFFVDSINTVLTSLGMTAFYWKEIALPIGISFFIFQSITYSVDVYRKTCLPAKNYANYLLYIISFPQLIAGPIVRYQTIATEIENRTATIDDRLAGFYRFTIGLAKKVIIANAMALQSDIIFADSVSYETLNNLSSAQAWLGVIAFTFQIYFDFSGYSDMAIGLGRIMGFHYPENFDNPYLSKNVSEFWKRWHITLGDFMKNYLYIPLGGNRTKNKVRHFFNLWIVFLLSGLWHGANWTFVLWGAYHGFFIILDKIAFKTILQKIGILPKIILTFFVVSVGWSLFASNSLEQWGYIVKSMFSFKDFDVYLIEPIFVCVLPFAILFSFCFEYTQLKRIKNFFYNKDEYTFLQHVLMFAIMITLFVVSLSHVSATDCNPFIYFRF